MQRGQLYAQQKINVILFSYFLKGHRLQLAAKEKKIEDLQAASTSKSVFMQPPKSELSICTLGVISGADAQFG
jgi:hypothetical protein